MDKRFAGILVTIVVIFVGVIFISQHHSNNGASSSGQVTSHIEGQGSSGVTLVEYGDYECLICADYYQPLKSVYAQLSSQIYFQFRNLPLSQIHQNAFAAARAAEAAGLQGKYWQMHDKLYENQNQWIPPVTNPLPFFDNYAKSIGLNQTTFDTDYASSKVNSAINADMAAFMKTGQQMATPTFFLDGSYLPNTQVADPATGQPSVAKFVSVIKAEITKKQAAQH